MPTPAQIKRRQIALVAVVATVVVVGITLLVHGPPKPVAVVTPPTPARTVETTVTAATAMPCAAKGPVVQTAGPGDRKVVALTFDDGPDPDLTPQFLDVLEGAGAVGTFYVVGSNVKGHEDLVQRMVADGDAVANHTMDHVNVSAADSAARKQITGTSSLIEQLTGAAPCIFRAPNQASSPELEALLGKLGLVEANWDVDSLDYTGIGVDGILGNVLPSIKPGSIVLMHDGQPASTDTLAALPKILKWLEKNGYETVTVPELLGLQG